MVKLKSLTYCGAVLTVAAGCLLPTTANAAEADGFKTFESQEYYEKHANELTQEDWYDDFASKFSKLTDHDKTLLKGLHYYLRLDPTVDLNAIKTHYDKDANPDNVNRVIKLMPKEDFEKMFPNSKHGPCSYLNLLKAFAVLPGLCSYYRDFKELTGIEPTEEMSDPDLIAKKILAAIMANAIQETSTSGIGDEPTLEQKLSGTFGKIREDLNPEYNKENMGPFKQGGLWDSVAEGNIYSGRGVHQVTYASNFANISLILYSDLRLVKYPDLVSSDTILPWLTTLIYFILPQSQYPTIAEVFDGQWERYIDSLPGRSEEYVERYKKEFPVCILLINGGIECGQKGIANSKSTVTELKVVQFNTKIRGGAYYHFAKNLKINDKELFTDNSPVDDKAITADKCLEACFTISQRDKEESSKGILVDNGLQWFRHFFLNANVEPISYCEGEMPFVVFAGKNVAKLYGK